MASPVEHIENARRLMGNTFTPKLVTPYQYWAQVRKVIDGDTVDLDFDVGFAIVVSQRVRLLGINAPELRGGSRQAGLQASQRLAELAPVNSWVEVRTYRGGREKFGRYLADLFVNGQNLSEVLLGEELVTPIAR